MMVVVKGYDDASYGDAFADVYDEWYQDISDVEATTAFLSELAGAGRVLELGIGTGRLAIPLARRGVQVHGVDASVAMLERLRAADPAHQVTATLGDMVDGLPSGPFALVFVAYNTFFGLRTAERQQACFHAVAARLSPGGAFVVEAFVPAPGEEPTSDVTVRTLAVDRVVLSVNRSDPALQLAEGQYVEFTEAGGVRLRPWSIRWATVDQLDEMAAAAGLRVSARWADFDRQPLTADSPKHVSVYIRT